MLRRESNKDWMKGQIASSLPGRLRLRVDGLAVHVVAVHQIGQPVTEHAAETAGGLVVVFAHENDLPFRKANFFKLFSKKGLTNP